MNKTKFQLRNILFTLPLITTSFSIEKGDGRTFRIYGCSSDSKEYKEYARKFIEKPDSVDKRKLLEFYEKGELGACKTLLNMGILSKKQQLEIADTVIKQFPNDLEAMDTALNTYLNLGQDQKVLQCCKALSWLDDMIQHNLISIMRMRSKKKIKNFPRKTFKKPLKPTDSEYIRWAREIIYTERPYVIRYDGNNVKINEVLMILDNVTLESCVIKVLKKMKKNVRHTLSYIPPYYPDLNPIEKIWAKK